METRYKQNLSISLIKIYAKYIIKEKIDKGDKRKNERKRNNTNCTNNINNNNDNISINNNKNSV